MLEITASECVLIWGGGGSHFRERGVHEKGGSQGVHKKGGSREPCEPPLATGLSLLDTEKDINRRNILAIDTFKTLNKIFDSRKISNAVKI